MLCVKYREYVVICKFLRTYKECISILAIYLSLYAARAVFSDWLVVSGVVSEYPVELDVVDFVGGLGLESLVNQSKLLLGDYYFHVVEDRSESGIGDKSTVALVLVLEEWLNQESSVSNISTDSLQAGLENSLFRLTELVLWVENGWGLECV
jgi:hypothetical protein